MKALPLAILLSLSLFSILGFAAESGGEGPGAENEVREAVSAFHAHIEPVWHRYYPAKDAAAIRDEIPALKKTAEAILHATEAGSPPDSREAAQKLLDSVDALSTVAAAGDEGAVMEAVERMHDRFHALITTLRLSGRDLH